MSKAVQDDRPTTWEQAVGASRPLAEHETAGPIFSMLKDGVPTLSVGHDLEANRDPGDETADELEASE